MAPCSASAGSHAAARASACAVAAARRAQRGVALRQRRAVGRERREIRRRRERERHVEIAAPQRRRARHDLAVGGGEHHRGECAERAREPRRIAAVDRHALAARRRVEAHLHRACARTVQLGVEMESRAAEHRELAVARAAHRAQQAQIVHGLEEIRLPVSVVADHDEPVGRRCDRHARQIPEIADREAVQPRGARGVRALRRRGGGAGHLPVKRAGRFSRKACIPSRMSCVDASSPK